MIVNIDPSINPFHPPPTLNGGLDAIIALAKHATTNTAMNMPSLSECVMVLHFFSLLG